MRLRDNMIHLTRNVTAMGWVMIALCDQHTQAHWRWADNEAPTCLFCVAEEARWRRG